jgi:hypothetical protein
MATVVVNNGLRVITHRLKDDADATWDIEPVFVGWGTGAGTAAITDTDLFTPKDVDLSAAGPNRTTGTSSIQTTDVTDDTYRVVATRTATGAGTVTNAGLWTSATAGNLFAKGDFAGIALASGDAIQFTFNIDFDN